MIFKIYHLTLLRPIQISMNVLAILPSVIPSTIIYTIKPLTDLHRRGMLKARIRLEFLTTRKDLEWADVVLFIRNYEWSLGWMLDELNKLQKPFLYDLDDNFFAVPLESSFGQYLNHPARKAMIERLLTQAALVRVYSKPLIEICSAFNSNMRLINGPFDWSLVTPRGDEEAVQGPVKIVYATSRSIDDNLGAVFFQALDQILEKHGDQVEVHFWGSNPFTGRQDERIFFHPFMRDYDQFVRAFSAGRYDIGLAPLLNDIFHRSKTNIKYREYSACRIAGIYSNVDVYSDHVQNGRNGLLVENDTQSWFEAINWLVAHPLERSQLAEAAYQDVLTRYSNPQFIDELYGHLQLARALPVQPYQPKPGAESAAMSSMPATQAGKPLLAKILHKIRQAFVDGHSKLFFQTLSNYLKGLVHIILIQSRITLSGLHRK